MSNNFDDRKRKGVDESNLKTTSLPTRKSKRLST
jgi:hypothetical protein